MPEAPDVNACVREAVDALTSRADRDPQSGRFTPGTLAAGTTLARSEQLWAALAPLKGDLVARVETDLAASDAAETKRGLIDAYAEARLLRSAMFARLVDLGGPITSKGRQRALYGAYLGALDREMKLAQALGLERKAKPAQSLADVLAAHEDEVIPRYNLPDDELSATTQLPDGEGITANNLADEVQMVSASHLATGCNLQADVKSTFDLPGEDDANG